MMVPKKIIKIISGAWSQTFLKFYLTFKIKECIIRKAGQGKDEFSEWNGSILHSLTSASTRRNVGFDRRIVFAREPRALD